MQHQADGQQLGWEQQANMLDTKAKEIEECFKIKTVSQGKWPFSVKKISISSGWPQLQGTVFPLSQ